MSEADFIALNKHLQEVRPIFDDFCAANGFVYVASKALGRYPRIRIERLGRVRVFFDLWMELDKDGKRFEKLSGDLPYELSAGASIVEDDGSKCGIRYQLVLQCFSNKPIDQVAAILEGEMRKHLHILEDWDVQYLKQNGKMVRLGC